MIPTPTWILLLVLLSIIYFCMRYTDLKEESDTRKEIKELKEENEILWSILSDEEKEEALNKISKRGE